MPRLQNMPVSIVEQAKTQRLMRRPAHTWQVRHKAFEIQPFMIAPVLPGETMKSAVMQARVVTDPIINPIVGWWCEHMLFYVKHRDLAGRDDFTQMMLEQDYDLSAYNAAADTETYHPGPGINWTQLCLQEVVEWYFRDEGESWNTYQSANGIPLAGIVGNSWLDSVTDETVVTDGDIVDTTGGTGIADIEELAASQKTWEFMRHMEMTNMDYEEWLGTYGVRMPKDEPHKPELLRFSRDWSYPTNTIDPSDGSPASAVSWAISERADKDRFFKEPGFIFGVTVARPKVYLSNQKGSAVSMLNDAFRWLPALMADHPEISLKEYISATTAGSGPLQASPTNGYWVDVRDLFIYGDQFVNFSLADTEANLFALPEADLDWKYPTETMAKSLFVDSITSDFLIRQDGVCNLNIAGTQSDQT